MNAEQSAEQDMLAKKAGEMTIAGFLADLDYLLEHSDGGLPHAWTCATKEYDGCTCLMKLLGRVVGYGYHQLKDWPKK